MSPDSVTSQNQNTSFVEPELNEESLSSQHVCVTSSLLDFLAFCLNSCTKRIWPRFCLEWAHGRPPYNGVHAWAINQFCWLGDFPPRPFRSRETVEPEDCFTPELVQSYYAISYAVTTDCALSESLCFSILCLTLPRSLAFHPVRAEIKPFCRSWIFKSSKSRSTRTLPWMRNCPWLGRRHYNFLKLITLKKFCVLLDSGKTFHESNQWNQTHGCQKMTVTLPPNPISTNVIEVL